MLPPARILRRHSGAEAMNLDAVRQLSSTASISMPFPRNSAASLLRSPSHDLGGLVQSKSTSSMPDVGTVPIIGGGTFQVPPAVLRNVGHSRAGTASSIHDSSVNGLMVTGEIVSASSPRRTVSSLANSSMLSSSSSSSIQSASSSSSTMTTGADATRTASMSLTSRATPRVLTQSAPRMGNRLSPRRGSPRQASSSRDPSPSSSALPTPTDTPRLA
ncbi:uncharacterized protein AMSG_04043, partial [Thecamonas trahens ATCC 50062]